MSGRRMTGARLVRSELTGAVYVITAWTQNPDGSIVASKKHDVTAQFDALVSPRASGGVVGTASLVPAESPGSPPSPPGA